MPHWTDSHARRDGSAWRAIRTYVAAALCLVSIAGAGCGSRQTLIRIDVTSDRALGPVSLRLSARGTVAQIFPDVHLDPTVALKLGLYVPEEISGDVEIAGLASDAACDRGRGSAIARGVTAGQATAPVPLRILALDSCGPPGDAGADGPGGGGAGGAGGTGAGGTGAGGTSGTGVGGGGMGGTGVGGGGMGGTAAGGRGGASGGMGGTAAGGRGGVGGTGGTAVGGRGGVGGTGGTAAGGRGGVGGTGGTAAGGRGGVGGTGGTAAGGRGGVGGMGGTAAGGRGGVGGAGGGAGMPCVEFLANAGAFTSATQGLTVVTENFARYENGDPVTQFIVTAGNGFFYHQHVTFESFVASDQAAAGTRSTLVVAHNGTAMSSIIGSYNGYDGLASIFAQPQAVVGIAGKQDNGMNGFTLSVLRSDSNEVASFNIPTTANGAIYAGARSRCGPVIRGVELRPNPQASGPHMSQYWTIATVSSGR